MAASSVPITDASAGDKPGLQMSKQGWPNGGERADVRVLVVDDSAVVRRVLASVVQDEPGLVLAGEAADGRAALAKVERCHPDVVVLDIEMPVMDGLASLVELKARWPWLPVIMFSTLTERGAAATLEALGRGADDYLVKPVSTSGPAGAFEAVSRDLVPLLRTWSQIGRARYARRAARPAGVAPETRARLRGGVGGPKVIAGVQANSVGLAHASSVSGGAPYASASSKAVRPLGGLGPRPLAAAVKAVVIGSSTGGPNALGVVVPLLPADLAVPVLVVQHMPPVFTRLLAERLGSQSALQVCEAQDGMAVEAGHLYVAPGALHMVVQGPGKNPTVRLDDSPPENSCKPSVDVLFRSAAHAWGEGVLAVVLTGMGQDGLLGAREVISAGGAVIAQDEASSVVWGMPGAVVKAGLAAEVLPVGEVAQAVYRRVRGEALRSSAHAGAPLAETAS
ncbi:MAG: protein-glutamate methylesterase/protein-glutamine glutaminase [Acidimicrobiales bacterium]